MRLDSAMELGRLADYAQRARFHADIFKEADR